MKIQIPRGVYDIYGKELKLHKYIVSEISQVIENYGYQAIKTPIFEDTNLFLRSVGESSDIVNKEMYTFDDRKGRSLTLRPELTAPTVRSYLEEKMFGDGMPIKKLYYYGEAFRYERAQAGRYRQFHQMGVEFFDAASLYSDVEVICLASKIIEKFKLGKYTTLKINTIGTSSDRLKYKEILQKHFEPEINNLCLDCQRRIKQNPMRILDCKIDSENKLIQSAPSIIDYLSDQTNERFEKIKEQLSILNIDFIVDHSLVRGLDYYNDTVFEFQFIYQQYDFALIAGGRYDSLINQLSGKNDIPAFGFGLGVERFAIANKEINIGILDQFNYQNDLYFIPLTEKAMELSIQSMAKLRSKNIICDMDFKSRSIKSAFNTAQKVLAKYVVVIGEDQVKNGTVSLKNMENYEKIELSIEEFEKKIIEEVKS